MLCFVHRCIALWPFVAFFCPKVAFLWRFFALNVAKSGKKWQKSGKKWQKNRQKLGKKWPILSRMGELLKGSFFGLFLPILSHPRGGVDPHGMGGYPHRGSLGVYV